MLFDISQVIFNPLLNNAQDLELISRFIDYLVEEDIKNLNEQNRPFFLCAL